jgi:hypothetical protein
MIHAHKPIAASAAEIERWPALKNPAVARCHQVWQRVHRIVLKEKQSPVLARVAAANAFRDALPALDTYKNIRAFITCIGFGITSGVLFEDCCSGLFRAADLALRADARRPKGTKEPVQLKKKKKSTSSLAN